MMCCLFGILDYGCSLSSKNITNIISTLSHVCEERGTDATGIAYLHHGDISIYKRPLPAHEIHFTIPRNCHVVMGHTRLTTQGSEKFNRNNHPFRGTTRRTSFALAHNGILHNDVRLRSMEQLPSTKIKTDSYVAVQLIEKQKDISFDSLRYMAEKVEGSFAFTVLDQTGNLYLIKGDNPMCIYNFYHLGFYLYASTEDILTRALKHLGLLAHKHDHVKMDGGDILMLDSCGKEHWDHFEYVDIHRWRKCRSWHDISFNLYASSSNEDYWDELRFMANSFGYSSDDIDSLRRLGYPPDAVEEMFYVIESWNEENESNYL